MITTILYKAEKECQFFDEVKTISPDSEDILWVDFESPKKEEIELLSKHFKFHSLAIEDCIADIHHPKIDDYHDYLFVILHAIALGQGKTTFTTHEIDFFLGKNYLVTFHKKKVKSINAVREELSRTCTSIAGGSDFLFHSILDRLVENYSPVIDLLENRINKTENQIFENLRENTINQIFSLKRDAMRLKRISTVQRDIVNRLSRDQFLVISKDARIYFRDTYDALFRINDITNSHRDLISGLLDVYFSSVSKRMNEVIKVLTIIATIMMPLTLITGIYGMNFRYMPEIGWKGSYFIVLGIMLFISSLMIWFFKKKKWL